jgi:hypothetical protein
MKILASCAVVVTLAGSRCAPLTGFAERSFSATEPAPERLVVAISFLDVEIVATPGPTVAIEGRVELRTSGGNEVAEREIERVAVRSERDGGTLTVRTGPPDSAWVYEGRRQGQGWLRIDLPPSIPIEIRTASGDVTLRGDFGDATLVVRTASGDLAVREGGFGSAEIRTASGDADLRLARPLPHVAFEGASGDLSIDRLAGPASVRSASGDVRIALVALTAGQRVAVDTASGDVTLSLAPGLEPHGGASTASGDLSISVPVALERRKAIFTGGADAGALEISTRSGDIRVLRGS